LRLSGGLRDELGDALRSEVGYVGYAYVAALWMAVLVSLNAAFGRESIDNLLFLSITSPSTAAAIH
jgi:hypothetical protein